MFYNIDITKKKGVWISTLYKQNDKNNKVSFAVLEETPVKAESFGELMIKIGEKNWVDLVNKNGND